MVPGYLPDPLIPAGFARFFVVSTRLHVREIPVFKRTYLAAFFWPIPGSQGWLDVAKFPFVAGAWWPVLGHRKRAYFGKPSL